MSRRTVRAVTTCALSGALLALAPATSTGAASLRGITLATPGTTQAVAFDAVSGDAVFFSTVQSLKPFDTHSHVDVYRFSDGGLTLMTPQIAADVVFGAAVRDGAMAFVSAREGGVGPELTLWRVTATGGGKFNSSTGPDAFFKAASADGSTVLFESGDDAVDYDEDNGAVDVIAAYFNEPEGPVSGQAPLSSNTLQDVHLVGASADRRSIVYRTDEAVDPVKDTNATSDLYGAGDVWAGPGYPPLLSDGTGAADTFGAMSANGATIAFTSADDNAAAPDTDSQADVYRSMGIGGDLISAGTAPATFAGATPGLEAVFYSTAAPLDPSDSDLDLDVYTRGLDGNPALISTDGGGPAHLEAVSATADVVYESGGRLFRFDGGLETAAPLTPAAPGPATFGALTPDGHVYFTSPDRLTAADSDNAQDVYVNEAGMITLVSGGTADVPAVFQGVNADGSLAVFSTTERLTAGDTDAVADLYTFGPVVVTPPDTTPPAATASTKTQKNDGAIEVTLACGTTEACRATPTGTLTVPAAARGKKRFSIKGPTVVVGAGKRATLSLKVPKKAKKAAAKALKAGRTAKAKITVSVKDAAGNERTVRVPVKLKA